MWRHTRNKRIIIFAVSCLIGLGGFSQFASAISTNIEASVCSDFVAPAITEPSPMSTDDSSVLVGGNGEPNMTVVITNNNVTVGTSLIAGDGSYSLQVPLATGDNVLVAKVSNDCQTKESASVTVHRNAPPQPPQPPPTPPAPSEDPAAPSPAPAPPTVESPGTPTPQPSLGEPLPSRIPPPSPEYAPPIITEPKDRDVSSSRNITVKGEAVPFSVVSIYANGTVVATVLADEDGLFSARVSLRPGKNTLQVRSALGDKAAYSESISVEYQDPAKTTQPWMINWLAMIILLSCLLILLIALLLYTQRKRRSQYDA